MALALVDRTVEAMSAADALLVEVAAGPASPYAQGIAHVAAFLVRFVAWDVGTAPASEPGGRWPVPPVLSGPATDAAAAPSGAVSFPLFEGGRRLIAGQPELAVAPLTEAVAQQRSGEGLLRSEAVALLAVALAAVGRSQDAARLLAEAPPDRVALYAGLGPWAASTVAAAQGDPAAVGLAFEAFHDALQAGSPISAIAYLDAASQYGATRQAADALESWGHDVQAPLSVARAAAIRARASGDGSALLEAAERLAALGVVGVALGLADQSVAALGRDAGDRPRAERLAADLRGRLGRPAAAADTGASPLTRRELEVATMAARGMGDRDIADVLVVSVRTVESHLASAYRKLAITSRRDLARALDVDGATR
jgi:DNA-binding CsgD family transcriptional regulator